MTFLNLPDPERIVVAGDWHGSRRWALHVIQDAGELLAGQPARLLLQLGDFGVDDTEAGCWYLTDLSRGAKAAGVTLAFVDGNHENFDALAYARRHAGLTEPVEISDGIWHLPRGCRWTWHGKEWLALGGAASPDRDVRIRHKLGWWEGEYLTEADILRAVGDPPRKAHVMVTHEAPSGSPIRYHEPAPRHWLQEDLNMGETHRRAIASVAEAVQAEHLFHGHHHQAYQATVRLAHGPVEVSGLDMNGDDGNGGVLNARTATWEGGSEPPRREASGG
jgi:hypothetical protein